MTIRTRPDGIFVVEDLLLNDRLIIETPGGQTIRIAFSSSGRAIMQVPRDASVDQFRPLFNA